MPSAAMPFATYVIPGWPRNSEFLRSSGTLSIFLDWAEVSIPRGDGLTFVQADTSAHFCSALSIAFHTFNSVLNLRVKQGFDFGENLIGDDECNRLQVDTSAGRVFHFDERNRLHVVDRHGYRTDLLCLDSPYNIFC